MVVVFWIFQFRAQLRRPFNIPDNTANSGATSTVATDPHNMDTDGDGLSDYDEVNIYHTSPYLEDTDGDGIPDGVEVKNGTDPNCPEGKVCNAIAPLSTGTVPILSATPPSTSVPVDTSGDNAAAITGLSSTTVDQATLQSLVGGQMDAATLRQLLIQSGADKASLDKISDSDLMKSYQETLTNQNTQ